MITVAVVIQCVILVLLLLCSAFFSSSETCLFSLNSVLVGRIRKRHVKARPWAELALQISVGSRAVDYDCLTTS